jgi:pyruvate formate-lyase activating enzyme-like uncharacterized protein
MKKEQSPLAEQLEFENPNDYASYLGIFGFKGVGFSGGEGFLVFEKLLMHIEKIRSLYKDKIYLWMYTNGDLVTKDKLKKLQKAGLDEMRFDISARNYNLQAARLAVGIINKLRLRSPVYRKTMNF